MEKLNNEDGQLFIKNLASFVRTHEKALANALQLKRQPSKNASTQSSSATNSASSALAAALSFGALKFTSQTIKPLNLP
ncbi:Leucine Rich Repeat domain protein [Aspergillus bombycis]|uniref:Leucine Rich Repeat domain protein n=1 Tax=Aspergillus bombycis TaxID=109264 RepID=A0A1F7ZU05_9EURO|nr:Leucine Rich Repeat domain protein [Aspergillus bombycis]OGM42943.1 Leucine Rich Repeat domain protein [Aspergillus bombycis]